MITKHKKLGQLIKFHHVYLIMKSKQFQMNYIHAVLVKKMQIIIDKNYERTSESLLICEFYILIRKNFKGNKFMQADIRYRSYFLLLG